MSNSTHVLLVRRAHHTWCGNKRFQAANEGPYGPLEVTMARLLQGNVRVEGVDHEDFTANEHPTDKLRDFQIVLEPGQPEQNIQIAPVKWGGECRVEVELNARLVDNITAKLTGVARFFEGASEETGELEDTKSIDFVIPRTTGTTPPRQHHVSLRNTTFIGAEDSAEVFLTVSNRLIEVDDDDL